MNKIKLEPFEIQMACDVATRRLVENIKMGKRFSYGFKGSDEKLLYQNIMGCCAEVAFAKSQNKYFNGSYSDVYSRYTDADMQDGTEVRSQKRKDYNFLLLRPGERKAKYVLVLDEGNFEFTIVGWFPFDKEMPERLTNFGHPNRPAAYKVEINELYDIKDL